MSRRTILTVCLVILVATTVPAQQDLEGRVRRLEEQNRRLVEQNDQILQRLSRTERRNAELEDLIAEGGGPPPSQLETVLQGLGDVIDDLDPEANRLTTWYGLVRSGIQLQFYGRLRLDSYYNSARFNRTIDPQWLAPEDGINAERDDDAFAFDGRLTTIGMNFDAGRIGDARVRGKFEFDFGNFNGLSESRQNARLLLAYIDIEFNRLSFRFGQDWDLISPYDPIVDAHRFLWDNGNLGDRRPLAQMFYRGGSKAGIEYDLGLALGATGSVENRDRDAGFGTFLSAERDGFDAGHPHVQASGSVGFDGWVPGQRVRLGISGAWGRLETDTEFNGEDHFTTWLVALDFHVPLLRNVHFKGELFYGQALADFRGGISQSVNLTEGDEIRSKGGWAEFYWQTTDFLGLAAGASIDKPRRSDLDIFARSANFTIYVASRQNWGGGLSSGVDVIFWKTQYIDRKDGDGLRVNVFVELRF